MKKTACALSLFALSGCMTQYPSTWKRVKSESVPGVVAIVSHHEGMIGYAPKCTGVLIRPKVILTAAHCVDDGTNSTISVIYGCHDLYDVFGCEKSLILSVYRKDEYDLALVNVEDDLSDKGIAVVDIAVDQPFEGKKVFIAGYGTDGRLVYDSSNIWTYSDSVFLTNFVDKTSPSQGYSGGPAYIFKNKKFFVLGISTDHVKSFEINNGVTKYYFNGIRHQYLSYHKDWIDYNLSK